MTCSIRGMNKAATEAAPGSIPALPTSGSEKPLNSSSCPKCICTGTLTFSGWHSSACDSAGAASAEEMPNRTPRPDGRSVTGGLATARRTRARPLPALCSPRGCRRRAPRSPHPPAGRQPGRGRRPCRSRWRPPAGQQGRGAGNQAAGRQPPACRSAGHELQVVLQRHQQPVAGRRVACPSRGQTRPTLLAPSARRKSTACLISSTACTQSSLLIRWLASSLSTPTLPL